jgi:methyl-accepting chemotaxis protein
MQEQAAKLAQVVSVFKLDDRLAAPVTRPAPVLKKPVAQLARPAARVAPAMASAAPARARPVAATAPSRPAAAPMRAKPAAAAAPLVKREPRATAAAADEWEEF